MRRLTIGLAAAVMLLALAPSGALASDHGSRHVRRVEHARVVGLSGRALTIRLRNGSTLRGTVNRTTELECTVQQRTQIVHDGDQSANDGSGDRGDTGDNDAQEPQENEAAEPPENEAAEPPQNEPAEPAENEAEVEVERSCSIANLTPGKVVREAELRISRAGHVWKKVELGL
jgi:hypothetical protein